MKWINTEIGTDLCENLIKEHDSYIKWIHHNQLISNEELNRVYNVLGILFKLKFFKKSIKVIFFKNAKQCVCVLNFIQKNFF